MDTVKNVEEASAGFRITVVLRIVTGFLALAIIGVGVGIGGLYYTNNIEKTLNNITDKAAPTVETAADLIANIWEANKVAEEIIADEELEDIESLVVEFNALDVEFDKTFEELKLLVDDKDLLDDVELAKTEQIEFVNHTKLMIESHILELNEEITAEKQLDDFDAVGAKLLEMLEEFAVENEEEMAKAENRGDELEASGTASVADVNAVLGELFERDYPVVEAALKLQINVISMQDTAGEYLAGETKESLVTPRDDFAGFALQSQEYIKILVELAETQEDKDDAARLQKTFNDWVSNANKEEALFDTHRDMLDAEVAADNYTETLETYADNVAKALNFVADKADAISDAADDEAALMVGDATTGIFAGIAGLGLIAAGLIVMVLRTVIGPINAMTNSMLKLAEGDVDVEIPAQNRADEIGDMSKAVMVFKDNAIERISLEKEQEEIAARAEKEKADLMNTMANNFEKSVGSIVDAVASGAAMTQQSAQTLTATAEQTRSQSVSVASSSEEASSNVQAVAAATEELSSSINEISRQVTTSSTIAGQAVKDADATDVQIQGLAEAANKIGEVVALITDIADQTNLLALNATIEAARAGDAGKGFAVVASEVKNLANQTAKATDEIGGQIGSIQIATQEAVTAVQGIGKTIVEIDGIASAIAAAVEEQGASTREIATNVDQAAAITNDVTNNISDVTDAASKTGTAAGEILSAAETMSTQSGNLRAEVDKFLATVRAG